MLREKGEHGMNRENTGNIKMLMLFFIMCVTVFPGLGNVVTAENRERDKGIPRVAEKSSNWESEDYKALQRAFYESPFFQGFTDDQLLELRAEIQTMIREAEMLKNDENYIEALRLLFDASYKEQRTQLLLGVDGTKQFPSNAFDARMQVERALLYDLQSPLMQVFRDPDFPIQEKRQYITELRDLAATRVSEEKQVLFRGKYGGTFIQLLTSPRLSEGEKFEVLSCLGGIIQRHYVSTTQHEQIQGEIVQLHIAIEKELEAQQYVKAFMLLTEALQKADDIGGTLISLDIRMIKEFMQSDKSPLMRLFKSRLTSSKKKQRALAELRGLDSTGMKTLLFEEKEYNGPLVQIFSNPDIYVGLKLSILRKVEEIIAKYSLIPW